MQTEKVALFFKKWSPDMTYILGFFAADGNLSINNRGGYYISFQSKDRQIISDIKDAMGSLHKISKRKNSLTNTSFYRLQIGSKEIVEGFQKIGFGKTKTKHLPFIKIPKVMFPYFVKGYFDGDGNIWQGKVHKERRTSHTVLQLAFTSASSEFLYQLKNKLTSLLKTTGCLVTSKSGSYFRLQFSTGDALKIYDFMYNTSTVSLCLKRKKVQFDRYIANMRA